MGIFNIRIYGFFIALSTMAAFYLAIYRTTKFGINRSQAEDIIFYLLVGGLLGARIYHVLSSFEYYRNNFSEVFYIWHGGLSIYGAVLGGALALYFYKKFKNENLSAKNLLNWLTPSVLLGQIIGRFGNLFNYEIFGYPTALPWKMFVPKEFRPQEFLADNYFHPLFLYEQVFNSAILLFLLWLEKTSKVTGKNTFSELLRHNLFLVYVLLYNTVRFGLEFLRTDSPILGDFRQNSVVSLGLVLLCAVMIFINARNSKTLAFK
ncbi:MAG: prolipoprotein diacylglyceryl transferase [Candidatus Doudnabacteria bacterium]|nr:prolipoprotein diacylglyceryl transferase [Candidatus Doudnabacteria bacterium]